jgi:hypothetical protein
MTSTRSLRMLNTAGHMTIIWQPESDDAMEAIIEKKMAAGCVFYLLEPVAGGLAAPRETELTRPMDARHRRALSIHDEDLAKFVGDGLGEATLAPTIPAAPAAAPKKPGRKAKTAKEVAAAPNAVGVNQRRGG